MPYYDYQCTSCGHEFSKVLTIKERNKPIDEPCPECETSNCINKIITRAPIVGYSVAPGLKTTDNFNDRLKEMKKNVGRENTLSNAIRN